MGKRGGKIYMWPVMKEIKRPQLLKFHTRLNYPTDFAIFKNKYQTRRTRFCITQMIHFTALFKIHDLF